MPRFVGYHERRPYLWYVDLDDRTIEATNVRLDDIPQGVDELVPLDDGLAVRCGPHWFMVDLALSERPRPLSESERMAAEERSVQVPLATTFDARNDQELVIPLPNGGNLTVTYPQVVRWETPATWSPDRRRIAVAGSTAELDVPTGSFVEALERAYNPRPSVLALIDIPSGEVTVCEGTFDNFCYPPAWTADGRHLAFGAPFEPMRVYTVDVEQPVLNAVNFKRQAPIPLLEVAFLHRA